jgi:hypothetical protein
VGAGVEFWTSFFEKSIIQGLLIVGYRCESVSSQGKNRINWRLRSSHLLKTKVENQVSERLELESLSSRKYWAVSLGIVQCLSWL